MIVRRPICHNMHFAGALLGSMPMSARPCCERRTVVGVNTVIRRARAALQLCTRARTLDRAGKENPALQQRSESQPPLLLARPQPYVPKEACEDT